MLEPTDSDAHVVHLAHARHAERGRVRALAHGAVVLARLDVHDDVGLGQRRLHGPLDRVGRRMPLADGGVEVDADHDVGEVASRGLAHAQPPQLDRRLDAGDGAAARPPPRRRARRSISTSTLRRISRTAASSTMHATKSAAIESACGWPARTSSRPTSTADRAAEVAAEMQRVRRERRARVAARGAHRRNRAADVDHDHDADHDERVPARVHRADASCRPAARSRARRSAGSRRRGSRPRRAPRGAPPSRARTGARCRPGGAATPTAKSVSSAAIRSVPECAASESRPRLCVARPVPSFSPIRAIAASTEKSAVRRCGVMAEAYSGNRTRGCRGAPARARSPRRGP